MLDGRVLAVLSEDGGPDQPDFLARLLADFLDDLPRRVQTIRTGLENRDSRAVREAAHVLKSSCGQLGAWRMQALCEKLESCPDDFPANDGGAMLGEVDLEASYLSEALQTEKMKMRPSA